jgi:hypothetical protein
MVVSFHCKNCNTCVIRTQESCIGRHEQLSTTRTDFLNTRNMMVTGIGGVEVWRTREGVLRGVSAC